MFIPDTDYEAYQTRRRQERQQATPAPEAPDFWNVPNTGPLVPSPNGMDGPALPSFVPSPTGMDGPAGQQPPVPDAVQRAMRWRDALNAERRAPRPSINDAVAAAQARGEIVGNSPLTPPARPSALEVAGATVQVPAMTYSRAVTAPIAEIYTQMKTVPKETPGFVSPSASIPGLPGLRRPLLPAEQQNIGDIWQAARGDNAVDKWGSLGERFQQRYETNPWGSLAVEAMVDPLNALGTPVVKGVGNVVRDLTKPAALKAANEIVTSPGLKRLLPAASIEDVGIGIKQQQPRVSKALYDMSPDELDNAYQQARQADKGIEAAVFGEEGAKQYKRAQQVANSSYGAPAEVKEAQRLIDRMEGSLTEVQRNRLFGIGDVGPAADDYRAMRDAVQSLDWESPQALGDSLKWALTKLGDETDPGKMSFAQQQAYAQLRYGLEQAREMGWNAGSIAEAALRGAAARFKDPQDAEVMLKPWLDRLGAAGTRLGSAPEIGGAIVGGAAYQDDPSLTPEENFQRRALAAAGGGLLGYGARKLGSKSRLGGTVEDVSTRSSPIPIARLAEETLERAKGTADQAAQLRPVEEGFAGNVRLDPNIEPAQKGIADTLADAGFNEFAGQRRGVVTDAAAAVRAREIASKRTIEDWLSIKPGTVLNQEERLALDQTMNRTWADRAQLVGERAAAQRNGKSTIDIDARIGLQTLEAQALTAVSTGARAEAGRLLRSYQTALSGEYGSGTRAIQKAHEVLGGTARFETWLDEFQAIPVDDIASQYRMMQQLLKPTKADIFNAWRYASMLSSWKTHAVNSVSNAGQAGMRPLTTALAGYPREAAADVYGMMRGVPEGIRAFGRTVSSGVPTFNISQLEGARPRPLGNSKLGRAVALPSDVLMAADDFWKAVNYSGVMHAEAYRRAGGNLARAEEILRAPTDEMVKAAKNAALYATYQNDPAQLVTRLIGLANTPGATGPIIRIFMPFIRTPANIYARGFGLVLQPLLGPVKMAMKAAKGDARAVRTEAAKTILAGTTLVGLWGMAASGDLTGQGPSDPAKRRILEESGWQANSIRIGGRWINYSNFGGVSVPMAFVAAVKEGADEGQKPNAEMLGKMADRVYNSMLDISVVRGLSDVLRGEGLSGRAMQIGSSAAGSLIPYGSALGAVERVVDPTLRAKDDPWSAVQGRIPIASQALPAEVGIYGNERRTGSVGDTLAQIILPWQTSTDRIDPVAQEVARLNQSPEARQAGVSVSVRQFSDMYAGAKQSPEQRRLLQGEAGNLAATYVADALSRPEYVQLSDAQKVTTLNKMLGTAYEVADLQLGGRVERDDRHKALLEWASTPQYEGVRGTPDEIRNENYRIAQAKAKLSEYRQSYGADVGEARLYREDRKAYMAAQRDRMDSDLLRLKKSRIDKAFGGALTQAENEGLVGAGNTLLPVGGR